MDRSTGAPREEAGGAWRCAARRSRPRWALIFLPVIGLASLAWFLIRVIPKPSRAAYPCQRVAFPLASSFVLWLAGTAVGIFSFHKARQFWRGSKPVFAVLCAMVMVSAGLLALVHVPESRAPGAPWTPNEEVLSPIGAARGIHPGRVVWVHDPDSTDWDGSNYWWQYADQQVVDEMMSKCLRWLTGESTDAAAWEALFRSFNVARGAGDVGYQAGQKVAIKCNLNGTGSHGNPGNAGFTCPAVVYALLKQLVNEAGVAPANIYVGDASRAVADPIYDLCTGDSNLAGVNYMDKTGGSGRTAVQKDTNNAIHFSNPAGDPMYLPDGVEFTGVYYPPQFMTQATYVINLASLKAHNFAGVTLCAKNHFGSTWNPNPDDHNDGWSPGIPGMHPFIKPFDQPWLGNFPPRPMGTYTPLVDLTAHDHIGAKTLLFMLDGLYPAKHQSVGLDMDSKWQSSPFNNDWCSSLLVSQDPVALDSVGVDILRNEPILTDWVKGDGLDNYLHEAALADDPPSGTTYDPNGDGSPTPSLGAHEHWNDAASKLYSRNLGTGYGIELIRDEPSPVVGRYVFYNNSRFDAASDDDAVAPDKLALRPGGTASFINYTSYSRGVNGIIVDVADLPGAPTAADFTFKAGTESDPAGWTSITPVQVTTRDGEGAGGSDRVTIVLPDGAAVNAWLQVTVKATAATGLTTPDVFYFGNAVGDTGDCADDACVTQADEFGCRDNTHTLTHNPAGITDRYDFNRDGKVGPTDRILARNNATDPEDALPLLTAP